MPCSVPNCGRDAKVKGLCFRHYMRLRRTRTLTTTRMTGDFWEKVKRGAPDECWPWMGYRKPSNGHGLTSHKGLPMHASRKAWLLTNGGVPRDKIVCHKCDNHICCNPDHMYLGTPQDNVLDQFEKPPFEQRGARDRKILLTRSQLDKLWKMRREGATLKACAERFDVHVATICRYITEVRKKKLEDNRRQRVQRLSQGL